MNVLNCAYDVEQALDEALDARTISQGEIGQLLDAILRTAEQGDRRRDQRRREEMQALEYAMDEALAQAKQEDDEIERIIRQLMRFSVRRTRAYTRRSRAS